MRCRCCNGPFHEATGDYDRERDEGTCGACYRPFAQFMKRQMSRPVGRKATRATGFYEAARTSIREGVFPQESCGAPKPV